MPKSSRKAAKRRATSPAHRADPTREDEEAFRKKPKRETYANVAAAVNDAESTAVVDGAQSASIPFRPSPQLATEQGIRTPPSEDGARPTTRDSLELPMILANHPTTSGVFKGAVDDLVDAALVAAPSRTGIAPGLDFISHTLVELRYRGIEHRKTLDIDYALKAALCQRMATFTAQLINNLDEYHSAIDAMGAALPFALPIGIERPTGEIDASHGPNVRSDGDIHEAAQRQALHGVTETPQQPMTALTPASQSNGIADAFERPVDAIAAGTKLKLEPMSEPEIEAGVASTSASSTGGKQQPAVDNELQRRQARINLFTERFPRSFDLFFYHVQLIRWEATGKRREDSAAGAALERLARAYYDNVLDTAEKDEWRALHTLGCNGDLKGVKGTTGPDLLNKQKVGLRLQLSTASGSSNTGSQDFAPELEPGSTPGLAFSDESSTESSSEFLQAPALDWTPHFVPYLRPETVPNVDAARTVQLIINTPDTPMITHSEDRLRKALVSAIHSDQSTSIRRVEKWNDFIWMITFDRPAIAEKWKDVVIDVIGHQIRTEHVYYRSPLIFISDFSKVNEGKCEVDRHEVATQVASAFSRTGVKPVLSVQECAKLYAGQQYIITVPRFAARWIRLYIPMRMRSGGMHLACFKPLNKTLACMLCRSKHGPAPCQHSKPVMLPVQNRASRYGEHG